MTLKELYKHYSTSLEQIYNPKEAESITKWVFESLAETSRTHIITGNPGPVSTLLTQQLNNSLQELLLHIPVQYVLGESWFYKLKLKVNNHVLIPRPETEELVQMVINDARQNKKSGSILDIGTGSGCIAIALKKNLPQSHVTAIDMSEEALHVARHNAILQNTSIDFLSVDFLDELNWTGLPVFDIVISNPPYIPLNEKEKLDRNVREFEPAEALFVPDESPLIFYAKIAAFVQNHGKPDGHVYVETHEDQAGNVAALFNKTLKQVEIIKDLFGKDRMVKAII